MFASDVPNRPVCAPTSQVLLSLPEINALCLRAARGAGFSWGMAEECGSAAVWLAKHQFDWSAVVLARLTGARGADVVPAPAAWRSAGPVCGMHAGATFADFAMLCEGPRDGGVTIGQVHDPLCVLPFVARAAQIIRSSIVVHLDGMLWAHIEIDGTTYTESCASLPNCGTIDVRPTSATAHSGRTYPTRQSATVAKPTYVRLEALALNMTVPSTAQSHARAGAVGSDND